jgi:hypothetical protein
MEPVPVLSIGDREELEKTANRMLRSVNSNRFEMSDIAKKYRRQI